MAYKEPDPAVVNATTEMSAEAGVAPAVQVGDSNEAKKGGEGKVAGKPGRGSSSKSAKPAPQPDARSERVAPSGSDVGESRASGTTISVAVSAALFRKIKEQAADEGIPFEELVREYLTESATLRAWEIIERKAQMRSGPSSHPQQQHRNGQNQSQSQSQSQRRKGGRGMSHGRYQSIMDDKANFLEYVRTQERNRR